MAATKIAWTKVPLNGGVALPALAALSAEGGEIAFDGQDTKTLILVENSASSLSYLPHMASPRKITDTDAARLYPDDACLSAYTSG